jgi:hypothetical protein
MNVTGDSLIHRKIVVLALFGGLVIVWIALAGHLIGHNASSVWLPQAPHADRG